MREVAPVDLVVEADHLVGQLVVGRTSAFSAERSDAEDERALLLQGRLELVELLVERDPHPNRPVT